MTSDPVTLTVPAPAPWISSNKRYHWAVRAKLTRAWREAAAWQCRAQHPRVTFGDARVRAVAHVRWSSKRRRDPANVYPTVKAIIDGCVDAGLLVDDDAAHLVGPDIRGVDLTGPALVTVVFSPCPDQG